MSLTMKTKKQKFDIDFIGGQGAITKAEEEALSAYFKQQKKSDKKTRALSNKNNGR